MKTLNDFFEDLNRWLDRGLRCGEVPFNSNAAICDNLYAWCRYKQVSSERRKELLLQLTQKFADENLSVAFPFGNIGFDVWRQPKRVEFVRRHRPTEANHA